MCEYCEKGKPLAIGKTSDQGIAMQSPNKLIAYEYDTHGFEKNGLIATIRFCPICGQRLIKTEDFPMGEKENDVISHPSHYCDGRKYEPVKVIQDWKLSFCCGNVVKYIARAGRKDGNSKLQDLLKARQYLEFEIEDTENEGSN